MLSKKNRLTRKKDLCLVLKKGRSIKKEFLLFKFLLKKEGECRLGIIVSKKILKKATQRNKLKRRIRAILRLELKKIKKKIDGVLIALPGIEKKEFKEIEGAIKEIFNLSKIVKQ